MENTFWTELFTEAELCVEEIAPELNVCVDEVSAVELCGEECQDFYPSAAATFGDSFSMLGTEIFDVSDNFFLDEDFTGGFDFGIDIAPVAMLVSPSPGLVPVVASSVCVPVADTTAEPLFEKFDELSPEELEYLTEKLKSYAPVAPFVPLTPVTISTAKPVPQLAQGTTITLPTSNKSGCSTRRQNPTSTNSHAAEGKRRDRELSCNSIEEKRKNRLAAAQRWIVKRERCKAGLAPNGPVKSARKEATAKRVRENGRFKKLGECNAIPALSAAASAAAVCSSSSTSGGEAFDWTQICDDPRMMWCSTEDCQDMMLECMS